MLKGKTRKSTYRAIYRLLDRVSPVPFDCGCICGAACCQAGEQEKLGLYLLPGEEKVHNPKDPWLSWERQSTGEYDFPPSWQGDVFFVNCLGPEHCRRALRPIQCRTFPLKAVILHDSEGEGLDAPLVYREEESELALLYFPDPLPYCCPLLESQSNLQPDFIKATYIVWKHLIRDPLIYDLISGR